MLLPVVALTAALGGDTDYHPCTGEEMEALAREAAHRSHMAVSQRYAGYCLTTGCPGEQSPHGVSVCRFLWCQYPHRDWSRAPMKLTERELLAQ